MTNLIDATIARKREEAAAAQAAQAAIEATAKQAKIEAEHAFMRAWLEEQPLWAELQANAAEVVSTKNNDTRALIGVDAAPLRLAVFALGVVKQQLSFQKEPENTIWAYWGNAHASEQVTNLEDVVITARELFEQQEREAAARAAENAKRAEQQAHQAEMHAREDARRDAALAEQKQQAAAQLAAWATTLNTYAQELAAVIQHNRPLLAAIAAKYNQQEFTIETVEIGVVATDDGMTWANTEIRDTLGKTKEGWWLELQRYGEDRVILKQYTHVAAVWQPLYRTPLTENRYARQVEVIIPNHQKRNPLTGYNPTPTYPEIWIAPMVDPNEVHAAVAAANLLPEPDYPEPPPAYDNYSYHQELDQIRLQAREIYYAALNIPAPAPENEEDIAF